MPQTLPIRPAGPTRELRYRFGENIRLKSPVQGYFYLEQYSEGVRRFEGIFQPSADDERWGGVCYDALNQPTTARFLIDQSIARHNLGAQLELARHWLRQGEDTKALEQLGKLEPQWLDPIDRMLWHTSRSEAKSRLESVSSALPDAERALLEVQNLPEFSVCAPWVYRQLGVLWAACGDDHSALYYLNRALEVTLNPSAALRLEVVASLLWLGRLEEAEVQLQALVLKAPRNPVNSDLGNAAALELAWGRFYGVQHKLEAAQPHFLEAQRLEAQRLEAQRQGQASGSRETLLEAHLALAALYAPVNRHEAELELVSARALLETPYQTLLFELRELQVSAIQKTLEPGPGLGMVAQKLLECAAGFEKLGRVREHCWALLSAANAQFEQGDKESAAAALITLEALNAQVQRVHNPALLWGEWGHVSEALLELLERHFPALRVSTPSSVIDLITLGQERIVVGGKIVPVPMRRFVEVLTYIHQHGEVSLAQVVRDIFSDEPLQKTRNYFHQLRHQLKLYTPQLEVFYNSQARTYRLESKLPLRWDVDGVRSGRTPLGGREFLPGSGSEWVMRLGADLSLLEQGQARV